jgi:hypothetical protein
MHKNNQKYKKITIHPHNKQAGADLRNFLSAGAAAYAVQQHKNGPRVEPENMYNMDMTSLCLSEGPTKAAVTRKVLRALHTKRRSAAVTFNQKKRRFGHLMSVVSADGEVTCIVAVIYDNTQPTPKTMKVCSFFAIFPLTG